MTLQTYSIQGTISIPYMANVSISYKNHVGVVRRAPITKGPADNHYIATFDEDDVDFNFNIQNNQNPRILFELETKEAKDAFIARENALCVLKEIVLEEGMPVRRLHFRQRAARDTYDVPSVDRMHFNVSYSLTPSVSIRIRSPGSTTIITFTMRIDETVLQLKLLIYGCYRVSPFRQTIYHGQELLSHNLRPIGYYFHDEVNEVLVHFEAIPLFIEFVETNQIRSCAARPSDSIRELEQTIQWEHSLLLCDFYLIHNGQFLAKDMTVQDCGLDENAVVRMQRGPQIISVKCYNEQLAVVNRVTVDLDLVKTTDAQFRADIAELSGISDVTCFVHLSNLFGNTFDAPSPITYPLFLVELYRQTIHEKDTFPVFIQVRGKKLRLNMENTATIGQIRQRVEQQCEDHADLTGDEIRLKGSESILSDEVAITILWPGCQLVMNPGIEDDGPKYRVLPIQQRPLHDIEVSLIPHDINETNRISKTLMFHRNPKAMIKPFVIEFKLLDGPE